MYDVYYITNMHVDCIYVELCRCMCDHVRICNV